MKWTIVGLCVAVAVGCGGSSFETSDSDVGGGASGRLGQDGMVGPGDGGSVSDASVGGSGGTGGQVAVGGAAPTGGSPQAGGTSHTGSATSGSGGSPEPADCSTLPNELEIPASLPFDVSEHPSSLYCMFCEGSACTVQIQFVAHEFHWVDVDRLAFDAMPSGTFEIPMGNCPPPESPPFFKDCPYTIDSSWLEGVSVRLFEVNGTVHATETDIDMATWSVPFYAEWTDACDSKLYSHLPSMFLEQFIGWLESASWDCDGTLLDA